MTKYQRIQQFNNIFKSIINDYYLTASLDLKTKMDIIKLELENKETIIVLNNFIKFAVDDILIHDNIKNKNIKFFLEFTKEDFAKKCGQNNSIIENIFINIKNIIENAQDKDAIIEQFNNLRKIAIVYKKLRENE